MKNQILVWTDPRLAESDISAPLLEDRKQVVKWGIQIRTPFEWLAYLTEEVGELSEAISEMVYRFGKNEDVRKEAIEVATLALKIAKMSIIKPKWREVKNEAD